MPTTYELHSPQIVDRTTIARSMHNPDCQLLVRQTRVYMHAESLMCKADPGYYC